MKTIEIILYGIVGILMIPSLVLVVGAGLWAGAVLCLVSLVIALAIAVVSLYGKMGGR